MNAVEAVPEEVVKRAVAFAVERYRYYRDWKKYGPKQAHRKTWDDVHRASYGVHSRFGYFISYAHDIGTITHAAQDIVEAERKAQRGKK
jgi:hypothetical protein